MNNLERGANIIINNWLKMKPGESLLIVTTPNHYYEAEALKASAETQKSLVKIEVVEDSGRQVGVYFDENERAFDAFQVIIGACEYSLVTTRATKRAIHQGKRFLSLPLSTNNGMSMLCFDFITMDTEISRLRAGVIMNFIEKSSIIRVTTALGSDMVFGMRDRKPGFFNGCVEDGGGFSSASIEIYIPIEEDKTSGTLILDGSYGYIGRVLNPFRIEFQHGRIVKIEDNEDGYKLKSYIEDYHDPEMYVASEFGIGLNSKSRCFGDCYIEDESSFGTFHIGFGRNIALGGKHEASGHYDLVVHKPDIYFDNVKIMERGMITIPEFRL